MDFDLAARVKRIKPSPTLSISAEAARLRAAGRDVVSLGAGEPDCDTPEHIKEAAVAALRAGHTKYTAVDGIAPLKQAIIAKFARDNGLEYRPEEIVVSCGAKQALFNLCQALLNPGDEALIPAPYWVSYPDIVLLADGAPKVVAAGQASGFKLLPEQLEAAITPRTRLLFLNSPSNPTGVMYTRAELAALGEVLLRHPQVMVVTDDIYEHMLLGDQPFANIVMACPGLRERTVIVNGVSKAYSMTGWRIGYAAGPAPLIAAMKKIQSQSTSNPTSIAQYGAVAALDGDQGCIETMNVAFRERHRYVVDALNAMPGVRCLPAQGAFYAFPDVSGAIAALDGVNDDLEFTARLLTEAEVAVVPGTAFGAPGHIRISFATSMEALRTALGRVAAFVG